MSTHHGPACGHTVLGTCTGCGGTAPPQQRKCNHWIYDAREVSAWTPSVDTQRALDEHKHAVSEPKSDPVASPDEHERALAELRDAVDSWRPIGGTTQWFGYRPEFNQRSSATDDDAAGSDSGPTREECMKKFEQVKFGPRRECPLCFVDLTPTNTWHHTVRFSDCVKTIATCSSERCLAWAYRVQDDAKAMRERAMDVDTSGVPVAKAPIWDRYCANCQSDVTPATIVAHVLQWVDGSREVFQTCSAERCLTWARNCVALAADTHPDRLPIAKASTAERMPEVQRTIADDGWPDPALGRLVDVGLISHESAVAVLRERLNLPPVPPLRPDGFSQSAVDAAKAVLLSTATKRGGK